MIAALFVQQDGCYYGLDNVVPYPEIGQCDLFIANQPRTDARSYNGPYPVVAHPPCKLWCKLAPVNFARYGGEHNRPGNDQGKFASALDSVHEWGGVLEHPANSTAFSAHGIDAPTKPGWQPSGMAGICGHGWICEVWQSAYGHRARKRTWLYYYSPYDNPPLELDWSRPEGTHQIGWHGATPKERSKPTLSKREASATTPAFRDELLRLARHAVTVVGGADNE